MDDFVSVCPISKAGTNSIYVYVSHLKNIPRAFVSLAAKVSRDVFNCTFLNCVLARRTDGIVWMTSSDKPTHRRTSCVYSHLVIIIIIVQK